MSVEALLRELYAISVGEPTSMNAAEAHSFAEEVKALAAEVERLQGRLEAAEAALREIEETDWFDGTDRLVWPQDITRSALQRPQETGPPA